MSASSLVGIIALPIVLLVGLLITRVATVMLTFTGLSRDLAWFQARSAFTCCGFTTREAERIAEHPVRRRIVMFLMLMGNGTVILAITSLVPFVMKLSESEAGGAFGNLFILLASLFLLWVFAASKWVDRRLSSLIAWALRTFTSLDVRDYHGLLHLSEGFTVLEVSVGEDHWVTGRNLLELRLADEGIQVLGIQRANGAYVGTPTGETYVRNGDTLLLYGREDLLQALEQRRKDEGGDVAHAEACAKQRVHIEEQSRRDRGVSRGAKAAPENKETA
ncbi:MAG TPA: TrkA C-terminal domain-containing protein [Candidatus Hydrogenedentes bacterium]|nr:TrkA C-terminal domain-containing protein [Candidatus Hydrogenedentota bacterium]